MVFQGGGQGDTLTPRVWAAILWGVYLAGLVVPVLPILAVVLAYLKKAELAGTLGESHAISVIRTFWIALVATVIGFILTFVLVGWIVFGLLWLWVLFRSVRGFMLAMDGRPVPDPRGWL